MRLKHLDILLTHTHSHSRTDSGVDNVHGQGSSLCASLQGRSPCRRSRPNCQVALGEGQHRDWVCWCVCLSIWKQAVDINSGPRAITPDTLINVGERYAYIHVHSTRPGYMSINSISEPQRRDRHKAISSASKPPLSHPPPCLPWLQSAPRSIAHYCPALVRLPSQAKSVQVY